MGHTNETTNLHLPQFIGSDKPTWLGDINGAFQSIDSAYATIETSASGAVSTANNAATVAQTASDAAASAQTAASGAATNAAAAVSTANNAAETANNAQSTAVLAKNEADEALAAVNRGSVSVTADGEKTCAALLGELFALIDPLKITNHSKLVVVDEIYRLDRLASNAYIFHNSRIHSGYVGFSEYRLVSTGSTHYTATVATNAVTINEDSATTTPTNGTTFTLYY